MNKQYSDALVYWLESIGEMFILMGFVWLMIRRTNKRNTR